MKFVVKLKKILLENEITINDLNCLINEKNNTNLSRQNLSKKINNDNIKLSDLEEILDAIGYTIEFVKKE